MTEPTALAAAAQDIRRARTERRSIARVSETHGIAGLDAATANKLNARARAAVEQLKEVAKADFNLKDALAKQQALTAERDAKIELVKLDCLRLVPTGQLSLVDPGIVVERPAKGERQGVSPPISVCDFLRHGLAVLAICCNNATRCRQFQILNLRFQIELQKDVELWSLCPQ